MVSVAPAGSDAKSSRTVRGMSVRVTVVDRPLASVTLSCTSRCEDPPASMFSGPGAGNVTLFPVVGGRKGCVWVL